jgi:hypothetical protein
MALKHQPLGLCECVAKVDDLMLRFCLCDLLSLTHPLIWIDGRRILFILLINSGRFPGHNCLLIAAVAFS